MEGGGGGGYDLGIALSAASSASSGLSGNLSNLFGELNVGGLGGLPKWAIPLIIVAGFGVLIVWLIRR